MIHDSGYRPHFRLGTLKGRFPEKLYFGFENEVECEYGDLDTATDEIHKKYRKLYAKDDGSLNCGCEINSHPFNWNWFLRNKKILDYTDILEQYNAVAERSCGFHVHIGKKYFTKEHLVRLTKFVYENGEFFRDISQRRRSEGLMEFADLFDIKDRLHSFLWNTEGINWNQKKLTRKLASLIIKNNMTSHYSGLSLNASFHTLEFRIFQGTTHKYLIQAYLECVLAMVIFTKYVKYKDMTVDNFIKFVKSNQKDFPKLNESKMLDKNCQYKWYNYAN